MGQADQERPTRRRNRRHSTRSNQCEARHGQLRRTRRAVSTINSAHFAFWNYRYTNERSLPRSSPPPPHTPHKPSQPAPDVLPASTRHDPTASTPAVVNPRSSPIPPPSPRARTNPEQSHCDLTIESSYGAQHSQHLPVEVAISSDKHSRSNPHHSRQPRASACFPFA